MKKLKNWWSKINEPDLTKAKHSILLQLTQIDGQNLSLEQTLTLFKEVKSDFDEMVLNRLEIAEKEKFLCEMYLSGGQTKKAKIIDVAFDKPLSNLEKQY